MKIPDGNKPIRVGDTSFIYKGVYHPINWLGKDPYRPRVEMLVIKDARYLYVRLKDDIEKTPPDKRTHKYSIPGGSIDADSSKLEQAIAETNEEALVSVTLVYHSGIQYYDKYDAGFLLKGGDMPIEYVGSVSDVYVGVYDGPYDKSKVEEKDLDEDMATKGKFHEITKIAKYLRKEHVEALLNSQFVANDVKVALRLYRLDMISEGVGTSPILAPEDNKIYHGSTYEIEKFQPMSLDLGNAFDSPGWSTFCFGEYEYAKLFGASRAFSKLLEDSNDTPNDELRVEFVNGHMVMSKECFEYAKDNGLLEIMVKFYVYTIDCTNLELGIGNDPALKEYTFRESNVVPENTDVFTPSLMDFKEVIEIVDGKLSDIIYPNENEYSGLLTHNYQTEVNVKRQLQNAIAAGELRPGDDIEEYMSSHSLDFDSEDVHIPTLSMGLDEPVFESIDLSQIIMEGKYPDDCYGLPERKAYPMPDEKHVRTAIRFFNYAKEDEEEELANNINKKIQKFKIKDINVGKKNRFKKYYQPINESFTISEFYDAMQECADKLQSIDDQKEKYKLYDSMCGLVRMFVVQLNANVFEEVSEADKDKMISAGYAALAEIAMNQLEIVSTMESADIRTLTLPVFEADDDEIEGATDYTAMADEAGAEDDETSEPETSDDDTGDDGDVEEPEEPTEGGDDGDENEEEDATDYTAMADEAGAEGTGEDETGEGMEDDSMEDDSSSDDIASDNEDTDGNDNRYNNKMIKNYFLLNNFLSLHQTVIDVLDTVNGVILPTPEANSIMAKVVKNLQDVKSFVEKFIQFHFSENDYAFNLYYYNLLVNVLRLNLKLYETAVSMSDEGTNNKKEKEE